MEFIRIIKELLRVNILKTVYINFKLLPFKQAIKMPIFLYGQVAIHTLSGKVIIDSPSVHRGMIKVGYRWLDFFPASFLKTQLYIKGTIRFNGTCTMSGGVGVFAQEKMSIIEFGDRTCIGGGSFIKSMDSIKIGRSTRITSNCTIMDCNMHYVKDIETGFIARNRQPITIGSNCWINSGTVVTKGAIIMNYSVVARNSFLNKDYSSYGENAFIVGSPGKVVNNKVQRIFNEKRQAELNSFFKSNPSASYFDDGVGVIKEDY